MNILCWVLLAVSTVAITLLIWYIKSLMRRILELAMGLGKLKVSTSEYATHLEYLYSLETYNGEPVIQDLIKRTKKLTNDIQNSYDLFSIIEGEGNKNDGQPGQSDQEVEEDEDIFARREK